MKSIASGLALAMAALLAASGCQKAPDKAAAKRNGANAEFAGPPATIDWAAAQADRASASINQAPVTVRTIDGKKPGPPLVPILLAQGVQQVDGAGPPLLVLTHDGYFAAYRTAPYDAVINGSLHAYRGAEPAAGGEKSAVKFSIEPAGAQIGLSRYGANYLIQFECHDADGPDGCISEDDAKAFVDALFVQQAR